MNKKDIRLKDCLELFPLRVAITDYCNLKCFFCSNEGMPLSQKNKTYINIKQFKYLITILANEGLKNVSITGGEPTMHPEIIEIIEFLNRFKFKNLFLHTNGISLDKKLLKKLSRKFNKIAVSIQSANFNTWQKITYGTKAQFEQIISNLELLSEYNDKFLVELKCVPIKGYNDSEKEFKDFLDLCNTFGFKFKFLNFEPIILEQIKLVIPFEKIKKRFIDIGCLVDENEKEFRGQSNYLPIKNFRYKNILGVAIEIGCGESEVCKECYRTNEIFITPMLRIKPCHISNYEIDLKNFIEQKNKQAIFKAIINSRLFLAKAPGAGFQVWKQ